VSPSHPAKGSSAHHSRAYAAIFLTCRTFAASAGSKFWQIQPKYLEARSGDGTPSAPAPLLQVMLPGRAAERIILPSNTPNDNLSRLCSARAPRAHARPPRLHRARVEDAPHDQPPAAPCCWSPCSACCPDSRKCHPRSAALGSWQGVRFARMQAQRRAAPRMLPLKAPGRHNPHTTQCPALRRCTIAEAPIARTRPLILNSAGSSISGATLAA
jgi:hypothetical protein